VATTLLTDKADELLACDDVAYLGIIGPFSGFFGLGLALHFGS
jgi:hypothetical protein